jgi:hypothetical protein
MSVWLESLAAARLPGMNMQIAQPGTYGVEAQTRRAGPITSDSRHRSSALRQNLHVLPDECDKPIILHGSSAGSTSAELAPQPYGPTC